MRFHATFASAAIAVAFAVTPAFAAKITVSQYGRLVATLPWAVALEKGMFRQAGLDIDGITAGSGGGTSMRNLLASELPIGEVSTSVALAAAQGARRVRDRSLERRSQSFLGRQSKANQAHWIIGSQKPQIFALIAPAVVPARFLQDGAALAHR